MPPGMVGVRVTPDPARTRLEYAALPAAFRSADLASLKGQRQALGQVRWSLWLGMIAAAAGIVSWRVGKANLDLLAAVGVAAFIGALTLTLRLRARGLRGALVSRSRGRRISQDARLAIYRRR